MFLVLSRFRGEAWHLFLEKGSVPFFAVHVPVSTQGRGGSGAVYNRGDGEKQRKKASERTIMRRLTIGLLLFTACTLIAGAAHAQTGACEANGEVKDRDGNPIKGVVVTYTPKTPNPISYTGKTNKKGRYFIAGMFNTQGDDWSVTIEAEGWAPVQMRVESRTVNRVLVFEPATKEIKGGNGPWDLPIRPLGTAKVDFTMAPSDEVEAERVARSQAAAAAAAAESGQAPAQPTRDPWDEALTLASDGDLDGAIPLFEKAIKNEPEDAERRSAFSKVLYQLGRMDEAEEQALAAIELAPDDVDTRMVLYSVYMGDGELDRAKAVLEAAREVAPEDTRILKQLAFVADEAGNQEDAIAAWEAVTAVDPTDTEAWMSLGDLYAATGDMTRSGEAYQKVTELDPGNAHQIFYNLGALIMNEPGHGEADTRKAIQAFRKAVEIKPDYAQAYKQLAFALLNVGDRAGAKTALENYVKHAPNAPDAAQMKAILQTLSK